MNSPSSFSYNYAQEKIVYINGNLYNSDDVNVRSRGVRPAISLKPGIKYTGGTGTMNDPYVLDEPEESDFTDNYQQVEYIESDGNQFIDVGVKDSTTIDFAFKIYPTYVPLDWWFFGVYNGVVCFVQYNPSNLHTFKYRGGSVSVNGLMTANQYYDIQSNANGIYENGNFYPFNSGSNAPKNANIRFFQANGLYSANAGRIRLCYLDLYDNGTLVRNFIPCYRKSDGVIGLYDLCGSICPLTSTPFYINSGTGAFTKGANKTELVKCDIATYDAQNNVIERCNIWHDLPREFQRVEYIESHGTEYVDTGIKMQSGYKWEVEMAFTGFTNTFQQIGAIQQIGPDYRRTHCGYAKVDAYDNLIYYPNSESENAVMIAKDTSFHKFATEISSGYFKISIDNVTANKTFFAYPNLSLYLFARNFGGSPTSWCTCRIKSSIITNGNSVIQNLVPCYRKSDNVIGLYDTINDKFYTNQGTGTFGKGADVN